MAAIPSSMWAFQASKYPRKSFCKVTLFFFYWYLYLTENGFLWANVSIVGKYVAQGKIWQVQACHNAAVFQLKLKVNLWSSLRSSGTIFTKCLCFYLSLTFITLICYPCSTPLPSLWCLMICPHKSPHLSHIVTRLPGCSSSSMSPVPSENLLCHAHT